MVKVEGFLLSADVLVACVCVYFVLPFAAFKVDFGGLGSLFKEGS